MCAGGRVWCGWCAGSPAARRRAAGVADDLGGGAPTGRRAAADVGVREGDVRVLLRAAERLGKRSAESSGEALRSLTALCAQSGELASIVVSEDGAAVVRELARAHPAKHAVQVAAVELLATLASPSVAHWAQLGRL
jgi:hypothetical protein